MPSPVQRWRLTFERGDRAAGHSQQDLDSAWEVALSALRPGEANRFERPRLVIGAPLPVGMTAGRELADLLLPERRRLSDVRAVLDPGLPRDHRLVDLYDVWVGEPSLPGLIVAGDYRVAVAEDAQSRATTAFDGIAEAVRALLDTSELSRTRTKADRTIAGNLRPLILDLAVADSKPGPLDTLDLWMRLRFHPSEGTGRPEEVVAALGSILGRQLTATRRHRERLWLRGELPD